MNLTEILTIAAYVTFAIVSTVSNINKLMYLSSDRVIFQGDQLKYISKSNQYLQLYGVR